MSSSYRLCAFLNSNSDCAFLSRLFFHGRTIPFQFQQAILTERRKPTIGPTPDSVAGVTSGSCPGQSPGLGRKWQSRKQKAEIGKWESRKQKAEIPIRAFSAQRFGGHRGFYLVTWTT